MFESRSHFSLLVNWKHSIKLWHSCLKFSVVPGCSVPKYSNSSADSFWISFILLGLTFHFDSLHILTVHYWNWGHIDNENQSWQSKPIKFTNRQYSCKHPNEIVEISLFCIGHLIGLIVESIVSVLPSDWFSLSGWPCFQLTHWKCENN